MQTSTKKWWWGGKEQGLGFLGTLFACISCHITSIAVESWGIIYTFIPGKPQSKNAAVLLAGTFDLNWSQWPLCTVIHSVNAVLLNEAIALLSP